MRNFDEGGLRFTCEVEKFPGESSLVGKTFSPKNRGVVLWLVMFVLLILALLAFSLSYFKSEELLLLGKSFDQNRMMALAKSALNEGLITCKRKANRPGTVYDQFRSIFPPPTGARGPAFPFSSSSWKYELDQLPLTQSIIDEFNLGFTVDCEAKVTYTREVNKFGSPAYRGYLELISTVYAQGKRCFRLLERREVIAVDFVDFFDRYALFVKYFPGYDVNRVDRRLTVTPITPGGGPGEFSRIYLGKEKHPMCSGAFETVDPIAGVYLDVSFNNGVKTSDPSGKGYASAFLKNIFPSAAPTDITPLDSAANSSNFSTQAFFYQVTPWTTFAPGSDEINDYIGVKRHYLKSIVEPAIANDPSGPYGGYSAANQFVKDFENRNPKTPLAELLSNNDSLHACDFRSCAGFQLMVNSYKKHWQYHFAYVGADDIWDVDSWAGGTPNLTAFKSLITDPIAAKYYPGIKSYITYAGDDPGGLKNTPKVQVGRMQRFWGPNGDVPAVMEGDVYLRFFKIGFFDEFYDDVGLWKVTLKLRAPTAVMPFAKPESPVTGENFLYLDRTPLINDVGITHTGGKYPLESCLMSRAVDNIPFNRLLGTTMGTIAPAGIGAGSVNPTSDDPIVLPTTKSVSGVSALEIYPLISPSAFSHIYEDGPAFLSHHQGKGTDKVFLDGKVLVRKGPLDLTRIRKYSGCGLIRVSSGDIKVSDLEPDSSGGMACRLVLYTTGGKIIISGGGKITASLIATSFSGGGGRGNGMLDFSGGSSVQITGNVIVDHLNLDSLGVGGHVEITHDPEIFEPKDEQRYRISISRSKTAFALDSAKDP